MKITEFVKDHLMNHKDSVTVSINRQVVWSLVFRIEELERIADERERVIREFVNEPA